MYIIKAQVKDMLLFVFKQPNYRHYTGRNKRCNKQAENILYTVKNILQTTDKAAYAYDLDSYAK